MPKPFIVPEQPDERNENNPDTLLDAMECLEFAYNYDGFVTDPFQLLIDNIDLPVDQLMEIAEDWKKTHK